MEHVFEIRHFRPELKGNIVEQRQMGEAITMKLVDACIGFDAIMNQGRRQSILCMLGSGPQGTAYWRYIAIGTSAEAPAATQTALSGEIAAGGGARQLGTQVRDSGTLQLRTTFAFTSSFAVQESGVLNKASSGSILARGTFAVKNVANGDSLQVTHKIRLQ